jgi:hypothetical protein
VQLDCTILKIPAGASRQKAVANVLEGIGARVAALPPARASLLTDQMLLAIAPAYVGVLSRPRLALASGDNAEVKVAENVPIGSGSTPARGDIVLNIAPDLHADGGISVELALQMTRVEGTVGVALDSVGVPVAKRAAASGSAVAAPGGCIAFTSPLGADEVLIVVYPRPLPPPTPGAPAAK